MLNCLLVSDQAEYIATQRESVDAALAWASERVSFDAAKRRYVRLFVGGQEFHIDEHKRIIQ